MQMTSRLRPLPLAAGVTGFLFAASIPTLVSRLSSSTMATSTNHNWPVKQYTPRHTTWPYTSQDFSRQDPSNDGNFYSQPRFVTHIDDAAIATLREYYSTVLPRNKGARILDFCSSWVSHYPEEVVQDSNEVLITGMGMNKKELDANPVLNNGRILRDLNEMPDVREALVDAGVTELFDVSTNVVSTDYLTRPVEVLRSLLEVTKPGGSVHLTISNRCFPTKAIGRWLRISEEERLQMVGDFLHFAGWSKIEIVELSNGRVEQSDAQGGIKDFVMAMYGRRDPLWVVRAVKE